MNFREQRLARKWTYKEMAHYLDLPVNTYRDWEKGTSTPRAVTLEGIKARLTPMELNFRAVRGNRPPKEMAFILGVSVNTYNRWERNEHTPNQVTLEGCAARLKKL
jgi:transcriptional regulator with XRE-family HTH domain